MGDDILVPFFIASMFAWIAWVIFSTIRRYSLAKMQSGVQIKLLEKVDSSQALLAYAETESGRRFLESLRVEQVEPAMPYRRILSGAQSGVVLSAFGIGMLLLHSTGVAPEREFTIFAGSHWLLELASFWLRRRAMCSRARSGCWSGDRLPNGSVPLDAPLWMKAFLSPELCRWPKGKRPLWRSRSFGRCMTRRLARFWRICWV